jgi:hypothetical protein
VRIRVACERCGAHKDEAAWPGPCFVCGYGSPRPNAPHAGFRQVPPSLGDLAGAPSFDLVPLSSESAEDAA